MLSKLSLKTTYKQNARRIVALFLVACVFFVAIPRSNAGTALYNKQALLGDYQVDAVTFYEISFSFSEPATYGSLRIEVCANDPLPGTACTPPPGFDLSNAVLSAQTGPPGMTILPGSTASAMVLGRTPAAAVVEPASYRFDQIVNPANAGAYYIRLQTFASADGTGPSVFYGGIALLTALNFPVTATIPPYLTFCTGITITGLNCSTASGDYIDFGELSSKKTSSGTSQMLAFTNAQSGYNISLAGTTMQSGNNEIKALSVEDVSRPGTSQFGLNLTNNSSPNQGAVPTGPGSAVVVTGYSTPDKYRFVNSEILASTTGPDNLRLFTSTYIVNVPASQAPGIYVTTITYVCLATF
jgi:hypothetical protein